MTCPKKKSEYNRQYYLKNGEAYLQKVRAHYRSPAGKARYYRRKVKEFRVEEALNELEKAVDFLEQCKRQPEYASEVGAMRDAIDWVQTAAAKVVAARKAKVTPGRTASNKTEVRNG